MKKSIYLLWIFTLIILSCEKNENCKTSGYFILTEVKNPAEISTVEIPDDPINTSFDLGELKASKEFYFILSNGGGNPIRSITLSSNSSAFIIFPESINSLLQNNSTNNLGLNPLISIGIIHGTKLNGLGYTELLSMDENIATISITGKTLENGDTVNIFSDFDFSVDAKVFDIQLFDGEGEIDVTEPKGDCFSNMGQTRYYSFDNEFNIKNIGNVPFSLSMYTETSGHFSKDGESITILPDEICAPEIPSGMIIFELDSDGTICDPERIHLEANGKGYFGLDNQ